MVDAKAATQPRQYVQVCTGGRYLSIVQFHDASVAFLRLDDGRLEAFFIVRDPRPLLGLEGAARRILHSLARAQVLVGVFARHCSDGVTFTEGDRLGLAGSA